MRGILSYRSVRRTTDLGGARRSKGSMLTTRGVSSHRSFGRRLRSLALVEGTGVGALRKGFRQNIFHRDFEWRATIDFFFLQSQELSFSHQRRIVGAGDILNFGEADVWGGGLTAGRFLWRLSVDFLRSEFLDRLPRASCPSSSVRDVGDRLGEGAVVIAQAGRFLQGR